MTYAISVLTFDVGRRVAELFSYRPRPWFGGDYLFGLSAQSDEIRSNPTYQSEDGEEAALLSFCLCNTLTHSWHRSYSCKAYGDGWVTRWGVKGGWLICVARVTIRVLCVCVWYKYWGAPAVIVQCLNVWKCSTVEPHLSRRHSCGHSDLPGTLRAKCN